MTAMTVGHATLRAPRDVIGDTLVEIGRTDPRLVVLDADLGRSTRLTAFEEAFPQRFLQLGVAEQNAVGVATGLSYGGFHPVFVTFAMFAVGLPWTQLRQAAYAGASLTLIGTHPGLDAGPDGGTHQMLEDLALSRVIPEVVVLSPADIPETRAAIRTAIATEGLVYVRVGRHPVPDLHTVVERYPVGKAEVLLDAGRAVVLVADGSMAATALEAGRRLVRQGVAVSVVNVRCVKPLDATLLRSLVHPTTLVATVENHSVMGGLGGAVAELLDDQPCRLLRLGVPDSFGVSATTEQLRQRFGLDADAVVQAVLTAGERPRHDPRGGRGLVGPDEER